MLTRSALVATWLCLIAPCLAQTGATPYVLTKGDISQTLDRLYEAMRDRYVDPVTAKRIEASLRKQYESGAFDEIKDGAEFAKKVSDTFRVEVTDAHLRFRYSATELPHRRAPGEPSPEEIKRMEAATRYENSAFDKVERLPGNVGYLSFRRFYGPDAIKRPVQAAFGFLANTDALIIDLRGNGGGDPMGVQLLCSYLFDGKPMHLNDITFREGSKFHKMESWTLKKVDGPRYLDRPVFVLVSKRTGSGAEECAYDLQNLHRAQIVGEPTWGGANPGGDVRLSDHFSVFVPVGRAENPYTHTNWEGVGVKPDIAANPKAALSTAHQLALKLLIEQSKDPERRNLLKDILDRSLQGEGLP